MNGVAVVEQYFAAWRRRDVEALTSLLHADVEAVGPLATVHGGTAHASSLIGSAAMFRDIAVDQMLADDKVVISWARFELLGGVSVRMASRCEVVEDLIVRVEVTFDPRPLLAARSVSE
jgi:hypothetical protein